MPLDQSDLDNSKYYNLGGERDPRVVGQGLDAPRGATYAFGDPTAPILLQKTSALGGNPNAWSQVGAGGGGGGGTQIPVVLVDPVAPTLHQQWILYTPQSGVPGLSGSLNLSPLGGAGNFLINTGLLSAPEQTLFAVAGPMGGFALVFSPTPAPFISVNPSPSGLTISFPSGTTAGAMVTALNAWAAMSIALAPTMASLSVPGDSAVPYNFPFSTTMTLTTSLIPESYVSKIQGAVGIKIQNWS